MERGLFLVATWILASIVMPTPICSADEAAVALKVQELGGRILKDDGGKVVGVILVRKKTKDKKDHSFNDDEVMSVDFSALPSLKTVSIYCSGFPQTITDRTVLHLLNASKDLEIIELCHCKATDASLMKLLKRHRKLVSADFHGCAITDASTTEIATLEGLRFLQLAGTKITDKGLKELGKMSRLHALDLSRTEVTDAGLKEMGNMTGLACLALDGTKVTDAGIHELRILENLRGLGVNSTKVTEKGKNALKKHLPHLQFEK